MIYTVLDLSPTRLESQKLRYTQTFYTPNVITNSYKNKERSGSHRTSIPPDILKHDHPKICERNSALVQICNRSGKAHVKMAHNHDIGTSIWQPTYLVSKRERILRFQESDEFSINSVLEVNYTHFHFAYIPSKIQNSRLYDVTM